VEEPPFVLRELRALPLSAASVVVLDRGRAGIVAPRALISVLTRHGGVSALRPGCREIAADREAGALDPALVAEVLLRLERAGILVRPPVGAQSRGAVPPASLAVVTRNRPRQLLRCLESHTRDPRCPPICVHDDSPTARAAEATLRAVRRALLPRGVTARYAGRAEKERYAVALAREAGVPPRTVLAALTDGWGAGFSRGANTNGALLDTAGEAVLVCDDDTIAQPAELDGPGCPLDDLHPIRFHPFPDAQSLARAVRPRAGSLLEQHATWLGRPAPDAWRAAGGPLDYRPLTAREVVLTWSGFHGDSGSSDSSYYLRLRSGEDDWTRDEDSYRRCLASRQIAKAPAAVALARHPFFQSVAFAASNARPLPPFCPGYRQSDTAFGVMVHALFPDDVTAYLPAGVAHLPRPARQNDSHRPGHTGLPFATLLATCVGTFAAPRTIDAQAAMVRLGRHLVALARLDPADLQSAIAPALVARTARELEQAEERLRTFGGRPGHWADDLHRWMAAAEQEAASRLTLTPVEVDRERARARLGHFGELLQAWPALRAAALRLRARGLRLGRPVAP
jgi:hypothetical protein